MIQLEGNKIVYVFFAINDLDSDVSDTPAPFPDTFVSSFRGVFGIFGKSFIRY